VDTGIDQSLLSDKLRLSATYFYTHLQRVIVFDFSGLINPATDPFGRFTGYLNTTGGFARGVEFNANWATTRSLTFSGSYTYTDARELTPLVPDVYRSFVIPRNQYTAFAVERLGQRAFVDFTFEATDSYLAQVYSNFSSGAFRFPGLKRAGLGGSYRIPMSEDKGIRIFARAENLFNQTYYESGFLTPGLTARGGLQFEF
jgi:iron complex outermembrane receptor protein